jgi:hypothetical protein
LCSCRRIATARPIKSSACVKVALLLDQDVFVLKRGGHVLAQIALTQIWAPSAHQFLVRFDGPVRPALPQCASDSRALPLFISAVALLASGLKCGELLEQLFRALGDGFAESVFDDVARYTVCSRPSKRRAPAEAKVGTP